MPKIPHPTIQSFFSPIPSKSTSAKRKHLHDGFDDIPPPAPPSPWTPKSGIDYTAAKIGAIKPGPGRITFTGRVANFREQERNPRAATAAKVLLRMALMDDTGVIDVFPPTLLPS